MGCLDELRKQQAIGKKVYDQKLMDGTVRTLAWERLQKNIVMDGDTMVDKEAGGALGPQIDSTDWKDKFQADFIVFIDYKFTCCKAGKLHILNGTDTLGT